MGRPKSSCPGIRCGSKSASLTSMRRKPAVVTKLRFFGFGFVGSHSLGLHLTRANLYLELKCLSKCLCVEGRVVPFVGSTVTF